MEINVVPSAGTNDTRFNIGSTKARQDENNRSTLDMITRNSSPSANETSKSIPASRPDDSLNQETPSPINTSTSNHDNQSLLLKDTNYSIILPSSKEAAETLKEIKGNIRTHEHESASETFDRYEANLLSSVETVKQTLSNYDRISSNLTDQEKSLLLKDKDTVINDLISQNPAYLNLIKFTEQYPEFRQKLDDVLRTYKKNLLNQNQSSSPDLPQSNESNTPTPIPDTGDIDTSNDSDQSDPITNTDTHKNFPTDSPNTEPNLFDESIELDDDEPIIESSEQKERRELYEKAENNLAKFIALRRFRRTILGSGSTKQDDLSKEYQQALDSYLEISNLTDSEKIDFLADRYTNLYQKVYEERTPKSKFLKKFSTWLEKEDSEKNKTVQKAKKILAVGAISLAAGMVTGAILPAIPIIGSGLVGGVFASLIVKNAAEVTVSQKLSAYRQHNESIDKSTLKLTKPEQLTNKVNEETQKAVRNNRRKAAAVLAGGIVMGALGGTLSHHLLREVKSPVHNAHDVVKSKKAPTEQLTNQSVKMVDIGNAEYPWDYFAQHFGANNATPMIEKLAGLAQKAGYKINSFQEGINSIVSPNGTVYNTTQGIVSALLKFN